MVHGEGEVVDGTATRVASSEVAPRNERPADTFATRTVASAAEEKKRKKYQNLLSDDVDNEDERSTADYMDEADELSTIKAKTMSNMVEDLPSVASQHGGCKLLILTSKQADLVAKHTESIDAMLNRGFEIPKPRLVIHLQPDMTGLEKMSKHGDPFEYKVASERLDRFIGDHIIPLAAKTNAVIIGDMDCMLMKSMTRMTALRRARWHGPVPFTVISTTLSLAGFYRQTDPKAHWRNVRAASKCWRQYEKKGNFVEKVNEDMISKYEKYENAYNQAANGADSDESGRTVGEERQPLMTFDEFHQDSCKDISTESTNLILVDMFKGGDLRGAGKGPYNRLTSQILAHLASTLPSLALKVGKSAFNPISNTSVTGLNTSVNTVQSGTPLILLDTRSRPTTTDQDREMMPNYSAFIKQQENPNLESAAEIRKGGRGGRSKTQNNQVAPTEAAMESGSVVAGGKHEGVSTDEYGGKVQGIKVRTELIEWAKRVMVREQEQRRKDGKMGYADDVSDLAWFYDIFKGDGDPRTIFTQKKNGQGASQSLYAALKRAKSGDPPAQDIHTKIPPATTQAMRQGLRWLYRHTSYVDQQYMARNGDKEANVREALDQCKVSQLHDISPDNCHSEIIATLGPGETRSKYTIGECEAGQVLRAEVLLNLPKCYALNLLADYQKIDFFVNSLVRLDRLPPENPVEGLELLVQAWNEYDIAQHLADQYKTAAKSLFLLQLLVSWLIIMFATLSGATSGTSNNTNTDAVAQVTNASTIQALTAAVFGLTVCGAFLISFDAFVNAKSRWRQLRLQASTLLSMIWAYRARVGPFSVGDEQPDSKLAEAAFRKALVTWREETTSVAHLNQTSMKQAYKDSIFKHGQRSSKPQEDFIAASYTNVKPDVVRKSEDGLLKIYSDVDNRYYVDDCYSPVSSKDYIMLRLDEMSKLYRERIPANSKYQWAMKVSLLFASVVGSVLAHLHLSHLVTIITSFASALTAYSEFSDADRKIQRYSRAIVAIDNLRSWWVSIGPVDQASPGKISQLILQGEAIISEERLAWESPANREEEQKTGAGSSDSSSGSGGGAGASGGFNG